MVSGDLTGEISRLKQQPGKNIAGPQVDVSNVDITDAVHNSDHGDIDNVTQSPMTVNLDDDGNTLVAREDARGPGRAHIAALARAAAA